MKFNEAWAGLDVAKAASDATLLMQTLNGRRELGNGNFPRDTQGVTKFLCWSVENCGGASLDGGFRLHVAMEATGNYSTGLAKLLRELGPANGVEVEVCILDLLRA